MWKKRLSNSRATEQAQKSVAVSTLTQTWCFCEHKRKKIKINAHTTLAWKLHEKKHCGMSMVDNKNTKRELTTMWISDIHAKRGVEALEDTQCWPASFRLPFIVIAFIQCCNDAYFTTFFLFLFIASWWNFMAWEISQAIQFLAST